MIPLHLSVVLFFFMSLGAFAAPNFIVVIGDDVGWDAFGCTGTTAARTPNIDKLAKQSCQMNRFYCSVSQCAPCRAELYTGLFPKHNGVRANAIKEPRPDVLNIIDRLGPLGYRVGLTGKLHFGLGNASFDKIDGFSSNGNGSGQTHSLDGVRGYIKKAQAAEKSFCVFICSTHAHQRQFSGRPPQGLPSLCGHAEDPSGDRQTRRRGGSVGSTGGRNASDDERHVLAGQHHLRVSGKIAARSTEALAMYADMLPTMLDYAGGDAEGLDGRSLKGLWSNPERTTHRESVLITNVHPFWQKAIVKPRYKLLWTALPEREHIWSNFSSKGKFFSQPWTEWKDAAEREDAAAAKVARVLHPGALELYDIVDDPYETQNLAGEDEHQHRVNVLHKQLKALMLDAGETIVPPTAATKTKKPRKQRKKK